MGRTRSNPSSPTVPNMGDAAISDEPRNRGSKSPYNVSRFGANNVRSRTRNRTRIAQHQSQAMSDKCNTCGEYLDELNDCPFCESAAWSECKPSTPGFYWVRIKPENILTIVHVENWHG